MDQRFGTTSALLVHCVSTGSNMFTGKIGEMDVGWEGVLGIIPE